MALDKRQKKFIMKKVRKLGSTKSVKSFYNQNCVVDDFANKTARKLFNKSSNLKRSKIKRRAHGKRKKKR